MTIPMRQDYHSFHLLELVEQRQPVDENLIRQSNLNTRDAKGQNALYWGIKNHSKHNVSLLLKHTISFTVAYKLDALFHAIETSNLEALALLAGLGLNIDIQNDKGQSLLMKALEDENIMMVQYLINQNIDLYLMDDNYDMAEDYAKRCTNEKVFELVHYKILNDKASAKINDCTACDMEKKSLCSEQK